jgi:hypothetical protein
MSVRLLQRIKPILRRKIDVQHGNFRNTPVLVKYFLAVCLYEPTRNKDKENLSDTYLMWWYYPGSRSAISVVFINSIVSVILIVLLPVFIFSARDQLSFELDQIYYLGFIILAWSLSLYLLKIEAVALKQLWTMTNKGYFDKGYPKRIEYKQD